MTSQSIQFASSNISTMLLSLMVICIIVYGYIEFKRIHSRISFVEDSTRKIMNLLRQAPMPEGHKSMPEGRTSMPEGHKSKTSEPESSETHNVQSKTSDIENQNDIVQSTEGFVNDVEQEESTDIIQQPIKQSTLVSDDPLLPTKQTSVQEIMDITTDTKPSENEKPSENVKPTEGVKPTERIIDLGDDTGDGDIEIDLTFINKIDDDVDDDDDDDDGDDHGDNVVDPLLSDVANLQDVANMSVQDSATYEEYTIRQLKDVLTSKGLPTSGNKSTLIKRILKQSTGK